MKWLTACAVAVVVAGCARAEVLPLSADTIQVNAASAPICGRLGVQRVALKTAAIETIKRGFDRFMIIGAEVQNNVGVIGHMPVYANTMTTGQARAYGVGNGVNVYGTSQSTTTFSGGQPIIGGTHDQGLVVRMFKADDPAGSNAVSARETLGPQWHEDVVAGSPKTCT